jgi:putative alpha-1,2-mannosidase
VNDTIQDNIQEAEGQNIKAVLSFTTSDNEQILAKVGISSVDSEGARNNLETEIPDWDFEKVMNDARDTWNKELSKIKVEGGSEDQKTIFYTAVYHSFISPNVFSDADGVLRHGP